MAKAGTMYGYLNLLALPDSLLVEFEGDDGIFIPFRANPAIFVSDRAVNLRTSLIPMKGRDIKGNTHAMFANTTRDLRENLSPEEQKYLLPFLGKFYPVIVTDSGEEEVAIVSSKPVARRIVTDAPQEPKKDEYSDIPF